MQANKDKNDEEPSVATTSVEVFIRPLEVTVPGDFIYTTTSTTTTTDPDKSDKPQTFWSTMTSRIETETSIKRWSIPPKTETEGNPPGPEDRPSTKEGKEQEGRVIGITPNYKLGEGLPKRELNLGKSGFLPNGTGDYKVSTLQETYKQTFIDPRVVSNANMPHSARIPDARPKIAGDFPSEHSKRSQIKLEPLEQRRFRSTESRPVSTSNYLTESVERHREMEASRLKEFLKAKEGDANQPWNKPGWPGPQKGANDESLRELETIKQKIETLKRTTSQSMNDLRIPTPSQFEQNNLNVPSPISPGESGWLIKMRKDRYLNEASKLSGPKKYKSMDQLNEPRKIEDSSTDDPVHRQLRKEFHLTKYSVSCFFWQGLGFGSFVHVCIKKM